MTTNLDGIGGLQLTKKKKISKGGLGSFPRKEIRGSRIFGIKGVRKKVPRECPDDWLPGLEKVLWFILNSNG